MDSGRTGRHLCSVQRISRIWRHSGYGLAHGPSPISDKDRSMIGRRLSVGLRLGECVKGIVYLRVSIRNGSCSARNDNERNIVDLSANLLICDHLPNCYMRRALK
jgi:hypothetical protein